MASLFGKPLTREKLKDAIRIHGINSNKRHKEFPNSGSQTPDSWMNEQGYRMVIAEKHVAIYKIVQQVVYVYHIADTRTEYTKLFY